MSMKNEIRSYIENTGISQVEFARLAGVSPSLVYQYLKQIRPVSEKVAVRIEKGTKGKLTRQMLFPDDWQEIWPELAASANEASGQHFQC